MARAQLKDIWITATTMESANSILKSFCDQHNMRIETWKSANGVEVVASQGSQITTRFRGGWFTDPVDYPKRAKFRLSATVEGTHVEVEIEETLGVGILDSAFKRRYEEYFQAWMDTLASVLPPTAESRQARDIPASKAIVTSAVSTRLGHIFVSYRRSDSADVAGRIYDRLIGKFGKDCVFKDVDSIPLGLDFKDYLQKKVSECDVLLAIIGDRWLDADDPSGKRRIEDPADFVRIEIQSALERDIPVIPLLVRDAHMPREESLPLSLRKLVYRNGIPIRSDPDFHRDMDRLISALEKHIRQV